MTYRRPYIENPEAVGRLSAEQIMLNLQGIQQARKKLRNEEATQARTPTLHVTPVADSQGASPGERQPPVSA